jgi:hypothetical protein
MGKDDNPEFMSRNQITIDDFEGHTMTRPIEETNF